MLTLALQVHRQDFEMKIPTAYYELSAIEKKRLCNGCGPHGWKSEYISNSWFISGYFHSDSLKECCNVHDFMYHVGVLKSHKTQADKWFLYNMNFCIARSDAWWWLKKTRQQQAKLYYKFVCEFGDRYFYD